MTIDPRLIERRQEVAEDNARRNIGRVLKFLVALSLVGALAWLLFSPYLSISEVRTAGIAVSSAHMTLAELGVLAGNPMVMVRTGLVEAALEQDPWIAEARVHLNWPDTVIVRVEERVPVAWVETGGGWVRRAADGVAVPSPEKPDSSLAWIQLTAVAEAGAESAPQVLGAVEFVAALPPHLRAESLVRVESDGELWAQVDGYRVRLGRPIEMTAKALSLVALLEQRPDPNSILTLIAPSHPAVSPGLRAAPTVENPDAEVDGDAESGSTEQP